MKTSLLYLFAAMLIFSSCKKNDPKDDQTPDPQETYLNTTAGSTWTYHETNNSGATSESDYTLTSTAKDTTINNKAYHIYDYSFGGSQYLNISGHSYYQYDSLPGGLGQIFERLYLKDDAALGATWSQDVSVPVPVGGIPINITVKINNKIEEKGQSRTVNGVVYNDVIHVSTTISSAAIPSASLQSDIHSYFAKKYGMIESSSDISLDFMGITQAVSITTKLTSATLK